MAVLSCAAPGNRRESPVFADPNMEQEGSDASSTCDEVRLYVFCTDSLSCSRSISAVFRPGWDVLGAVIRGHYGDDREAAAAV